MTWTNRTSPIQVGDLVAVSSTFLKTRVSLQVIFVSVAEP